MLCRTRTAVGCSGKTYHYRVVVVVVVVPLVGLTHFAFGSADFARAAIVGTFPAYCILHFSFYKCTLPHGLTHGTLCPLPHGLTHET